MRMIRALGPRLRYRSALVAPMVLALTLAIGCGDSAARYSDTELSAGVTADVDDDSMLVESATVFLLPDTSELNESLEADRIVVAQQAGFDVLIAYRAGPYCRRLPTIEVRRSGEEVQVAISSHGGDCDDMEYGEAVGLIWAEPEYQALEVVASHEGP